MKSCKTCHIEKELSEFFASKRHADNHMKECKTCHNFKCRERRKNNPDHKEKCNASARKSKRKYKEKRSVQGKIYRAKNKEKIDARNKIYNEENKEKIRIRKNLWAKNNPQVTSRTKVRRRTAEKRAVPEWADQDKIKKVYEKAKWLGELTGLIYHVDHVIPLTHPDVCGLHCWANLQILEQSINCAKGNRYDG